MNYTRFYIYCLFAMGLLLSAAAETELVRMSVEEEAGVPRFDEPVTVGVPFAEGVVQDVSCLVLIDESGQRIPSQFTEVSRWRTAKGGIRWTHLDFKISVPAKGKQTIRVVQLNTPASQPSIPLKVNLENNVVTVVTGYLKFIVRGYKFNGLNGLWYDSSGKSNFNDTTLIIPPDGNGGSRVEINGKKFLSINDSDGKVEIESQGPMKVVVKAYGTHKTNDGNERRFDYVVRFYAFAGSPILRISHTFINRQGVKPSDMLEMDALEFDLPTSLAKVSAIAGTDSVPCSIPSFNGRVSVFQKSSDEFVVLADGNEKARGKGKSVKPLSLGWMSIGSNKKYIACGLRWFWQMHPKEIAFNSTGMLTAGLYPISIGKAFDVYMGQSRTHYLTLLCHEGMEVEKLNSFFIGIQMPLRPWASCRYYCRDTLAFGYVAESDPAIFPPDKWSIVEDFDRKMLASLKQIRKKLDGFTYVGYTTDSYGFYNWGDTFHWGWAKQENSAKDTYEWHLSWEGNYYDYPNLCLMQMIRTGNRDYYWHAFEPNTIHVRDVFTCQYHPKKELYGACRYCPPRNHVALDDGTPYVSNEFNHNKSQCVFAHWYLTGDWRTREVLELMMNNGLNNRAADVGFANRGIGAHLALVWQSWELTGDEKYRNRILQLLKCAGKELESTGGEFKKGPDPGIGQEGLVYAHWATGDAYAEKLIQLVTERWVNKGRKHPSSSLALAYGAWFTGNEHMREYAWGSVAKASQSPRPKDTAGPNRNIPFALYFLSTACPHRSATGHK